MVPSLQFPHQDPIHPLLLTHMPHAQPILFFSILSPAQYWVRSTNHLSPHSLQSDVSSQRLRVETLCSVETLYRVETLCSVDTRGHEK